MSFEMTPDEPTILAEPLSEAELSAQERRQDAELLMSFRQDGNVDAFEALYGKFMPGIYGKHLRSTGDPYLAEDLAQETFIKAMGGAFDGQSTTSNVNGWLHRIANNQDIDAARRRARLEFSPLIESNPSHQKHLAEEERTYDLIEARGSYAQILAAIPEQFRRTFVAYFVEQQTAEEVAASQGIEVATVRTQVHRARRAAIEQLVGLAEQCESSDDYLGALVTSYLARYTAKAA
jgi:RNA polymerase sigma-70 factor (ECF subfamily)